MPTILAVTAADGRMSITRLEESRRMTTQTDAARDHTADAELRALATCPLCHTVDSTLRARDLAAGGSWKCGVCGQFWDAERLQTAAAYRAWARTLPLPKPWSRDAVRLLRP